MIQIKNILSILSLEEKKQLFFLFFINLLVALSDMVGVASIMPFISLLSDQQLINKSPVYNNIYIYFNFTDPRQFVFVYGLTVFSLIVMSITLKALTTYLQIRFALMREYTIGKRLVKGYLNHSYVWFLNKNSGDLGKSILSELQGVIVEYFVKLFEEIISTGTNTYYYFKNYKNFKFNEKIYIYTF